MLISIKSGCKYSTYYVYTNSQDQYYFPLLAVFIANYKEQVMLIGIKSGYTFLLLACYVSWVLSLANIISTTVILSGSYSYISYY